MADPPAVRRADHLVLDRAPEPPRALRLAACAAATARSPTPKTRPPRSRISAAIVRALSRARCSPSSVRPAASASEASSRGIPASHQTMPSLARRATRSARTARTRAPRLRGRARRLRARRPPPPRRTRLPTFTCSSKRLLRELGRTVEVAAPHRVEREAVQHAGATDFVLELLEHGETRLVVLPRLRLLPGDVARAAVGAKRAAANLRGTLVRASRTAHRTSASPPSGRSQTQKFSSAVASLKPERALARCDRPGERSPKVVLLRDGDGRSVRRGGRSRRPDGWTRRRPRKNSACRRRTVSRSSESSNRSTANWRTVSSIRNRSLLQRRRTRLLSTSDWSTSSPSPHTASAASSVKPPENTARLANRRCSASSSSSWLHSIVARSVRWRSGASRAPPVSRGSARSSRARSSAGASMPTRAAASSTASGSPSRRRQISATAASAAKLASTARARSMNSATASVSSSGSTAYRCSPWIRSGSRLVTRTRTCGAASRSAVTRGAPGDDLLEVVQQQERTLRAEVLLERAVRTHRRPRSRRRPAWGR